MNNGSKQQQQGTFGIFSLSTMIIGIVIGSGIFMKNVSLIQTNGSITITLISWLLASLIVFAIMISFIEILSITEKTGEQANLANWGNHLVNKTFGKFMGVMMGFIWLPLLICVLFSYSTSSIVDMFSALGVLDTSKLTKLDRELIQIGITLTLLIIFSVINSLTTKPGRILQNVGTSIKTIPLFVAIAIFAVMLLTGDLHFKENQEIIQSGFEKNNHGIHGIWLMILTIPPILFSLDGFLIAGLLSKEAKSKTDYRWALVIGLSFIVIIYVLFSMATFGLGNPNDEYFPFGSMPNLIMAVFKNEALANTLMVTMTVIIVISMITAASGCTIAASRIVSDMSEANILRDSKGLLVKRNSSGVSSWAGYTVLGVSMIWAIVFGISDAILYVNGPDGVSYVGATDFASNISVVFAFIIYVFVIGAALANRFSNKVEVEKNKLFWPSAIISISLVTIVSSIALIATIVMPLLSIFDSSLSKQDEVQSIINLLMFVFFVTMILVIYFTISYTSKKITDSEIEYKQKIIKGQGV